MIGWVCPKYCFTLSLPLTTIAMYKMVGLVGHNDGMVAYINYLPTPGLVCAHRITFISVYSKVFDLTE